MDSINLGVRFIKEFDQSQVANIPASLTDANTNATHMASNSMPQTGDMVLILLVGLLTLALAISGILIWNKIKSTKMATASAKASSANSVYSNKKIDMIIKMIFGSIGAVSILCIVIGCFTTMAHAAQVLTPLVAKEECINVMVGADGTLTSVPITVSNTSDEQYLIKNSSVSVNPGFEKLANTSIKITGFDGVVYEGYANGQTFTKNLTSLNALNPGHSTQVNIELTLSDPILIEDLYDQDVFKISLTPDKHFPSHEALMQYSWPELKIVSKAISNGTVPADEFEKFKNFAATGQSVVLPIPHESDTEDKLYMRIIDFNHDDKADGTGKAGITFIAENSIDMFVAYDADKEASTNWANSGIRSSMNTKNGEIYKILSSALETQEIQPEVVAKKYAKGYLGSNTYDNTTILTSNDMFFIPSYKELTGKNEYGIDTPEKMGDEGERYFYIGKDIWANTPGNTWHVQSQNTPVMSSLNHKTCELFENEAWANDKPTGECLIYTFDIAQMHWPEPWNAPDRELEESLEMHTQLRPDCVLERTLNPRHPEFVKTLNYAGRAEDNCQVNRGTNLTPCFCL